MNQTPRRRAGFSTWEEDHADVRVRFVGRGPSPERAAALAAVDDPGGAPLRLAWPRQIHSARVLAARPGECGEGDALVTEEAGLAVAVATADCVPILLAGPRGLAAVHAGWRGLAANVAAAAVATLDAERTAVVAWIGPAIGPCCYEVGEEVATQVAAASAPRVIERHAAPRPHLDLQLAARLQLERCGVRAVNTVVRCTRCHPDELWSFRRDGRAVGRNLAFVWRVST